MLDYTPIEPCPPFYSNLRKIMDKKGITRYSVTTHSNIKDSYFTTWQKGADPHIFHY